MFTHSLSQIPLKWLNKYKSTKENLQRTETDTTDGFLRNVWQTWSRWDQADRQAPKSLNSARPRQAHRAQLKGSGSGRPKHSQPSTLGQRWKQPFDLAGLLVQYLGRGGTLQLTLGCHSTSWLGRAQDRPGKGVKLPKDPDNWQHVRWSGTVHRGLTEQHWGEEGSGNQTKTLF